MLAKMYCPFAKLGCYAKFVSHAELKRHEQQCQYGASLQRFSVEQIYYAQAAGQISEMAKQIDAKRWSDYFDVLQRIAQKSHALAKKDLAKIQSQIHIYQSESYSYQQASSNYQGYYAVYPTSDIRATRIGRPYTADAHAYNEDKSSVKGDSMAVRTEENVIFSPMPPSSSIQPRFSPLKPRVAFYSAIVQYPIRKSHTELQNEYLETDDLSLEEQKDDFKANDLGQGGENQLARQIAEGFKALERIPERYLSKEKAAGAIIRRNYDLKPPNSELESVEAASPILRYNSGQNMANVKSVVNVFLDSTDSLAMGHSGGFQIGPEYEAAKLGLQIQQQSLEIMRLNQLLQKQANDESQERQLIGRCEKLQSQNSALYAEIQSLKQQALYRDNALNTYQKENEQLKKLNKELMDQLSNAREDASQARASAAKQNASGSFYEMQKTINQQYTEICELIQQNQELLLQQTKLDQYHDNFNNYIQYINKNVYNLVLYSTRNENMLTAKVAYMQDYLQMALTDVEETRKAASALQMQFYSFAQESANFALLKLAKAKISGEGRRRELQPTYYEPAELPGRSIGIDPVPRAYHVPQKPQKQHSNIQIPAEQHFTEYSAAKRLDPPRIDNRVPDGHNLAEHSASVFNRYQNVYFDYNYIPLQQKQRRSGSIARGGQSGFSGYTPYQYAQQVYANLPYHPPQQRNQYLDSLQKESIYKHEQVERTVQQLTRQGVPPQQAVQRPAQPRAPPRNAQFGPQAGQIRVPYSQRSLSSRRYY